MQKIMSFVASSASGKPSRKSLDDRRLDQPGAPPAPSRSEREGGEQLARVQKTFGTMMDVTARGDDESFTKYLSLLRTADADASHFSKATQKACDDSPAQTVDTRHHLPFLPEESSASRTEKWLRSSANLDKDVERETPTFWDVTPEDSPRTPELRPTRASLRSAPTAKRVASREVEYEEPDVAYFPAPPNSPSGHQTESRTGMRAWASAPVLLRRVSFAATPQVLIIP
ncbi:hypothetical protein T484DRAFT_1862802 [Baffinella frigidus]|nr:hypothetical protein T484DRAFT_1862802 [Cryptophyta sp. CCMP2293]